MSKVYDFIFSKGILKESELTYCFCGSGEKYHDCCQKKTQEVRYPIQSQNDLPYIKSSDAGLIYIPSGEINKMNKKILRNHQKCINCGSSPLGKSHIVSKNVLDEYYSKELIIPHNVEENKKGHDEFKEKLYWCSKCDSSEFEYIDKNRYSLIATQDRQKRLTLHNMRILGYLSKKRIYKQRHNYVSMDFLCRDLSICQIDYDRIRLRYFLYNAACVLFKSFTQIYDLEPTGYRKDIVGIDLSFRKQTFFSGIVYPQTKVSHKKRLNFYKKDCSNIDPYFVSIFPEYFDGVLKYNIAIFVPGFIKNSDNIIQYLQTNYLDGSATDIENMIRKLANQGIIKDFLEFHSL